MAVRYLKFGERRKFGVEVEMNRAMSQDQIYDAIRRVDRREIQVSGRYQQDYDNDYWVVKFDRSCGDVPDQGGWEVASYVARKGYADVKTVGKVVESLRDRGGKVNRRCALHIHADVGDFTQAQLTTLMAYWLKIEKVVEMMVPAHRRGSKYCRTLWDRYRPDPKTEYTPDTLWQVVRPRDLGHQGDRRSALNVVNYVANGRDRRTVELRLPECVLDGREVKNWVRWFVHFVETCKARPFPGTVTPAKLTESLTVMGLHGDLDSFVVLSKGLWETKAWVLERIRQHSADRPLARQAADWAAALGA